MIIFWAIHEWTDGDNFLIDTGSQKILNCGNNVDVFTLKNLQGTRTPNIIVLNIC